MGKQKGKLAGSKLSQKLAVLSQAPVLERISQPWCICILGDSFGEIFDEGFERQHLRAHVSGYETFCLRKWFKIINLIRSYSVFWNTDKKVVQFRFQTQQNSSNQISNYSWSSKINYRKKKCPLFGECEKQLFPKSVRFYKKLEKYDIRYQLFMAISPKIGLGDNMALFDYSNKETLLITLKGCKNVYQKSDPYVHGHDPKVSKTGLTLYVSILVASRNATILLVQIRHRIIRFCSNVNWTIYNNIVEDNSLIKKFGDISFKWCVRKELNVPNDF